MDDLCIVIPSGFTKEVRKILSDLGLNDSYRRLKKLDGLDLVAIPVTAGTVLQSEDSLQTIFVEKLRDITFDIKHITVPKSKKALIKKPEVLLKERLRVIIEESGYTWTDVIEKDIPTHWERHGDLVLVPDTVFNNQCWAQIGSSVLRTTVECLGCKRLAQKSVVSQDGYRTPQVTILYGDTGWVEHVDNGVRYSYDITRCMFSSGNITEKIRVAKFDCTDEIVVDLYAGIGYFTLPYLVYTGVKHLHACEWNPDAVEALHRNLTLNGVQDKCTVHAGDNRQVCPKGVADRVNLGLIPSSMEGWPVACTALKPTGGVLHIHYNVNTHPQSDNVRGADRVRETTEREGACRTRKTESDCGTHSVNVTGASDSEKDNPEFNGDQSEASFHYNLKQNTSLIENNALEILNENDALKVSNKSLNATNSSKDRSKANENNECNSTIRVVMESNKLNEGITSKGIASETNERKSDVVNTTKHFHHKSKWMPWSHDTAIKIKDMLQDLYHQEWKTDILHIEHVKSYAPHVDHIVLDLKCCPL